MPKKLLPPIHPGEILLEEFLKPLGISQYRLAKEIGVPAQRIGDIVAGKRAAGRPLGSHSPKSRVQGLQRRPCARWESTCAW
jgi:hypothetical protein